MQTIRTFLIHWFHDPLHRNSFFLFASNATMAGLGFFFWLITARLYKTEYVGLATAAFSISALLAELGTFGLRSGLMHYLPLSTEKNRLVNTVMNLSIVICILIALVSFLLLGIISPKLAALRTSIPFLVSFVPFVVLSGVSFIVEAVFMVYRSAEYILIEDIILYGLKLIFPLFLIALTTIGIYLSWFFGLIAAEIICIIILTSL